MFTDSIGLYISSALWSYIRRSIYVPCAYIAPTSSNKHSLRSECSKRKQQQQQWQQQHQQHRIMPYKTYFSMHTQCEKWVFRLKIEPNMPVSCLNLSLVVCNEYAIFSFITRFFFRFLFSSFLFLFLEYCPKIWMRHIVRILNDSNIKNSHNILVFINKNIQQNNSNNNRLKFFIAQTRYI